MVHKCKTCLAKQIRRQHTKFCAEGKRSSGCPKCVDTCPNLGLVSLLQHTNASFMDGKNAILQVLHASYKPSHTSSFSET